MNNVDARRKYRSGGREWRFWSRCRANSSSSHRGLHGRRQEERLGSRSRSGVGISTIFVDKLQIGIKKEEIHEVFKIFGRIQEIHISHKKRRHTNFSFGFVKFLHKEDAHEARKRTKGLPVKGVRIFVDWAKYDWISKAAPLQRRVKQVWRPIHSIASNRNSCDMEFSGKELSALNKHCPEEKQLKSVEGEVCNENLIWLCNSLVVESSNPIAFDSMCSYLLNTWRNIVKIRSLGLFKLLLTFESLEELNDVFDFGRELLLERFEEVRKWTIHDRCESKRVWLEIVGIPVHAWCRENFMKIGEMWGDVVCVDNGTSETHDFSSGKVLVDTAHLPFIQDKCYLRVGDCGFEVNIKELGSYSPFKVCHDFARPNPLFGSETSDSHGNDKTEDVSMGRCRDKDGEMIEYVGEEQADGVMSENDGNLEAVGEEKVDSVIEVYPNLDPQHSDLDPIQECEVNNVLEETMQENEDLSLTSGSSRTAVAPVNYDFSDEVAVLSQLCNNKDRGPPGFEHGTNFIDPQIEKEASMGYVKPSKRKGRKNSTRRSKKNLAMHRVELDALLDDTVVVSNSDEESIDDIEEAKKTWSVGRALGLMVSDENEVFQALSNVRRSARLARKKCSRA